MNRPFVALLVALAVLASVNFVVATGPMIQRVFVTNWPGNQNVTVTNPPKPPIINITVNNYTVYPGKPFLDRRVNGTVYTVVKPSYYPSSLDDRWSTNFTIYVGGYRNLSLGIQSEIGAPSINRSQPVNVTLGSLATTETFYNVTVAWMLVGYDTSLAPGLATPLVDLSSRANCVLNSFVQPNTCPSQKVIVQGIHPLGPQLTVHIYYYRVVRAGYYYSDCIFSGLGLPPPSDPTMCNNYNLWGDSQVSGYPSDATMTHIIVYATE